ncbi:MAG: oxygenase MpaB family protein [Rhodomicrobium sp.]|jgi:uncharacterized protein (DUF2236 family)
MDGLAGKLFFLHGPIVRRLDKASRELLLPGDGTAVDFSRPAGEPALAQPNSVSWRIFKNPVTLFIGGAAAVLLELAEPRVRTGVWRHSGFRQNPLRRLRRTGLAAMVTVYGARGVAEAMIADVRRMHERVRGLTPGGEAYDANDPELLSWVQATAAFGFLQAYHIYAAPLPLAERDRYYGEGGTVARLYGGAPPPRSEAELAACFEAMRPRLEPSPIISEFIRIMQTAPILPPLLRPVQPLLVRAAVDIAPPWLRELLGLGAEFGLRSWEAALVRRGAAFADRIVLESSPAVQACQRLGLPADYLYKSL